MIWQILVLQILFFLVLIAALFQLFHGHVTRTMQRVDKMQLKNQKKEEELQKYQEKVIRECEEKLRRVDREIGERRDAAERELGAVRESVRVKDEEFREELEAEFRLKEQALTHRLAEEARRQGSQIAREVIDKALSGKMRQILHHELTEELLDSLSRLGEENVNWPGGKAKVLSAFPLTAEQKKRLEKAILACRRNGAAAIEIAEENDASLVGGFVLSLGQLLFDGSLKNKFEHLTQAESADAAQNGV